MLGNVLNNDGGLRRESSHCGTNRRRLPCSAVPAPRAPPNQHARELVSSHLISPNSCLVLSCIISTHKSQLKKKNKKKKKKSSFLLPPLHFLVHHIQFTFVSKVLLFQPQWQRRPCTYPTSANGYSTLPPLNGHSKTYKSWF